jgi:predicted nucleotidyltransferase
MVEFITNIVLDIMALYRANYLASFHTRELGKLLKKSHVTLLPHLKLLEKNKILLPSINGKNKQYSLNLDNLESRELLSMAEKKISLELIRKEFFIKKILEETMQSIDGCVVLFGSYAAGNQNKESDIDLLYMARTNKEKKNSLAELGRTYRKNIHLITISLPEFKDALRKKTELIKEVINNHVILQNQDIFVNELWRYFNERRE